MALTGRAAGPAPCQSGSDSGRAGVTHCEACHRLDRASRYRWVCPHLRVVRGNALCVMDAVEIRPSWGRAAAAWLVPPALGWVLLALGAWLVFRQQGLETIRPLDVLLPTRWGQIEQRRRTHFHDLALRSLAKGDPETATIALFNAAQSGQGTSAENRILARLATLGGHHALVDQLHAGTAATHPEAAGEDALAWLDDLLLADRPVGAVELALARLAIPGAPRDFWLRAFFENIRRPGTAKAVRARLATEPPHPGLRHALAARAALDEGDTLVARDQLLALEGLPPGSSVRRFLVFSWLDVGDAARAWRAVFDRSHPARAEEVAVLAYAVLHRAGDAAAARSLLRPLLGQAESRREVVGALLLDPDPELVDELGAQIGPMVEARELVPLWLVARRAGREEAAAHWAEELETRGEPLPADLLGLDWIGLTDNAPSVAVTRLPLQREIIYLLRALIPARPAAGQPSTAGPAKLD